MTIAERIKGIANKFNVSYFTIKMILYSNYGKTSDVNNFENRLNILENYGNKEQKS